MGGAMREKSDLERMCKIMRDLKEAEALPGVTKAGLEKLKRMQTSLGAKMMRAMYPTDWN